LVNLADKIAVLWRRDGDLPLALTALEEGLQLRGAPIYKRGRQLVRVLRDEMGAHIDTLNPVSLSELATQHIAMSVVDRRNGKERSADVPREVAESLIARGEWGFPTLRAIAEAPVVTPWGELLALPGYHPETELFISHNLQDAEMEPLAQLAQRVDYLSRYPGERLTEDEGSDALGTLDTLLEGFEFESTLDRYVALAALVTTVVRPGIATAPGTAIVAGSFGAGKTTLARMVGALATGRDPAVSTVADDDPAELRKLLFSLFRSGARQVILDNHNGPLKDATLAAMLTSPYISGRILGVSEDATLPTNCQLIVTGCGLSVEGDLCRRMLTCRLSPVSDRPYTRNFGFDPVAEILSNRVHYLEAACTVALYGLGCEGPAGPLGGFLDWSRMVRAPLWNLGGDDVAQAMVRNESVDPQRLELSALLRLAETAFPARKRWMTQHLIEASSTDKAPALLSSELREELAILLEQVAPDRFERNSAKRIGKWLSRQADRVLEGRKIARVGTRGGQAVYAVTTADGI
jgi:putative DNA primase/helicase